MRLTSFIGFNSAYADLPGVLLLGFRPFYLLASIFAALSIPLWAMQYAGWLPGSPLGPLWHAHEMLFGFTMAVVAGFLLTAVRNWTARPTVTGAPLACIALVWIAGRMLELTSLALAAAIVNAAFPLLIAGAIGIPLVRANNRRNYFFIVLMVALGATALVVDLSQLGLFVMPESVGLSTALDLIMFIVAVMAGRVIPMFTNNGVRGATARRVPLLERFALAATLGVLLVDSALPVSALLVPLLLVAVVLHATRLLLWKPWQALAVPLVWALHLAYAWLPVHLAMRALAALDVVPAVLATHALTIGVIGGMTIAMMTRTARGHTGQALRADGYDVACYALVTSAAVVRVFGPLLAESAYVGTVLVAATLWSLAYGLYAWRYWPLLTAPRADGKPG